MVYWQAVQQLPLVHVTAAVFCPLAPAPAVNVRVPHPCFVGAVREARVHVGSATTIVLLVAGTLEHRNVSTKVPEAPAVGLLTTSDVLKRMQSLQPQWMWCLL